MEIERSWYASFSAKLEEISGTIQQLADVMDSEGYKQKVAQEIAGWGAIAKQAAAQTLQEYLQQNKIIAISIDTGEYIWREDIGQ